MLYTILLFIHSWLRWGVLILAVICIYQSFIGWSSKRSFTNADNRNSGILIGLFHLQLLLGLLLYFYFSPVTTNALSNWDMKTVMKDGYTRYWAVEHIFVMILAVIIAQVGRIIAKKKRNDVGKHQTTFIYYTIALVLVLSRIPWNETARMFRSLN